MNTLRFITSDVPDNIIAAPANLINFSSVLRGIDTSEVIHLYDIRHDTMNKIVMWCNSYNETHTFNDEIVTKEQLFEIINAAHRLDIQPLLDDACTIVAEAIRGKTPEEIRLAFNITNDFTPEEEEKIRNENEWFPLV